MGGFDGSVDIKKLIPEKGSRLQVPRLENRIHMYACVKNSGRSKLRPDRCPTVPDGALIKSHIARARCLP